jgi:hypothetical protein
LDQSAKVWYALTRDVVRTRESSLAFFDELTHSTGHKSKEELVAEVGAAMP